MLDPKYAAYTVEDFVLDPEFIASVLHPDASGQAFRRALLRAFPQQEDRMLRAERTLLELHRSLEGKPLLTADARTRMYENIRRRGAGPGRVFGLSPRALLSIAAAALVLLLGGIAYYHNFYPAEQVFRTPFGETLAVDLPDGSRVDLNANSTLRFQQPWPAQGPREVWLEGEAYFDVAHLDRPGATFTVHTSGPDVVVLGTRFNVDTRTERTRVVLEEGAVRVENPNRNDLSITPLELKPGEMAEYEPEQGLRVRVEEKPELHSSWKDGYLQIEGYTFDELLNRIESLYGLQIELAEPLQNKNRVSGVLPTGNLEETIATLQILYGLRVERDEQRLIIKRRGTNPDQTR